MNILRAQAECLKSKVKEDIGKPFVYHWAEDDKNIYLTEGHKIEVIPKDKYALNIPRSSMLQDRLIEYVENAKKGHPAEDTHVEKITEDFTARVFRVNGEEKWFNKKLLKNFDLKTSEYSIYENQLAIYEENKLVGIVLAIESIKNEL